ncbi:MAG: acyl-CoA thioesterase [Simkaniaceae bacterium]
MEGKTPAESAINDHTYRIFPNDLNSQGTAFGGLIMAILDRIAHVVAERHSEKICVTACVDGFKFLAPAKHGQNLIFKASINRAWTTSMEIGVKVIAEQRGGKEKKHIVSAYFVFVALDDTGQPIEVPPVIPKSPIEKRRFDEARIRRENRIAAEKAKKERRIKEEF